MNYRRAGGSTKISFHGTELMQQASGEAKVESKSNRLEIDAKFESLQEATQFGLEGLTIGKLAEHDKTGHIYGREQQAVSKHAGVVIEDCGLVPSIRVIESPLVAEQQSPADGCRKHRLPVPFAG